MPAPNNKPPHSAASPPPSRPSETPIEILYNTAVQSFVRRDHVKTHATLSRLLTLLHDQPRPQRAWHDLGPASSVNGNGNGEASEASEGSARETEEWVIKTLKLVISSHASLYSDPPSNPFNLPPELHSLLPPKPPNFLLEHLVSTLLLASLKLKPAASALDFAHQLAEDWIARLPDNFVAAISQQAGKKLSPEEKKQVESAREGYLKVVELFVGEVLAREGEWEMARAFLDGEVVMGSKRKENLYRHLRAMQTKPRPPTSPSSSLLLPSPSSSSILPSPSPSPGPHAKSRSRSDSASSSSSEATARPGNLDLNNPLAGRANGSRNGPIPDRKGKGRAVESVAEDSTTVGPSAPSEGSSKSTLPRKIFVNHPESQRSRASSSLQTTTSAWVQSALSILSPSIRAHLSGLPSGWLASAMAIPLPLVLILTAFIAIRRRRRRNALASPAVVGGAVVTTDTLEAVRDRLQAVRATGLKEWFKWWLRWWVDKFLGVWRMGTTITYM
ncbi:hypothetical protein EHS25_007060 [Saitozyma podzolica]|uniref:Uncharacterized protein n=1 Tax=Saitozyma podzolica TaxID=1890683 RepID=A0A427XPG3_9TREE|nr:hypothetical protein EHS25_007060 [Saitozyma podzolica]